MEMNPTKKRGTLFLIPAPLGEDAAFASITEQVSQTVTSLQYFIAEELRSARRFIRKLNNSILIDELTFFIFNEHSGKQDVSAFLQPLLEGHDTGLLSEAGLPCIADPGAEIVSLAHTLGIRVVPLSGPSSILLALIASGFNGQQFAFHGYLPIDQAERIRKLKELERQAGITGQTQIFMETPYRNNKLLGTIVDTLSPDTLLCVAAGITTNQEWIRTLPVRIWRKTEAPIVKVPAVFIVGRGKTEARRN